MAEATEDQAAAVNAAAQAIYDSVPGVMACDWYECISSAEKVAASVSPILGAAIRAGRTMTPAAWEGDGPCHDCGGPNICWFAPNDVWNAVIPAVDKWLILCVQCFIIRAEAVGLNRRSWILQPETVA